VRRRIAQAGATLHAPEVVDLEVLQALRRQERSGVLDQGGATRAAARLETIRLARHPHRLVVRRVWELRHNLSAYDASYVALAELLPAPLLTLDRRLEDAAGSRADVEVFG
jgi:predicted nucleic acid-binding protein